MDKKTIKDTDKKIERVKDRGDLKKINNIKPNRDEMYFMPDRGDIVRQKTEKKKLEDSKRHSDLSPKKDLSKREDSPAQIKTYLDLEGRKCLRERYTLKLKKICLNNNSDDKVEIRDCEIKNVPDKKIVDESITKVKSQESSKDSVSTEPRPDKKPAKEAPCGQRKPIIKTVTVKNDNRVYKAVTFVDHKQHTPLQINIQNEYKKPKTKEKETIIKVKSKPSKESVKEKPVKKVKKNLKKERVLSPEYYVKGNPSPPTEVAKWAPSCINHHTKPYYEAWVDTTLAAISKCTNKDKLYFEKQNIIKNFQRSLIDRPKTPDLVYEDITDERYTGRIKVRQR